MVDAHAAASPSVTTDDPICPHTVILQGLVGSQVHGLNVLGHDDRDEMGICVEPIDHFFGLRPRFEQWIYRTQPEGHRSGPGDLDLTVYSLAKWARLAINGNPTILTLLFIPEYALMVQTDAGTWLRDHVHLFVGTNIFGPYLGYLRAQRHRLMDKVKMPNRPELIEAYGFDTKYAGHLLRLGYQGRELAETGRLELPMREPVRTRILDVRQGKVPEADVLEEAAGLEDWLEAESKRSSLGPPDVARIEDFVKSQYLNQTLYRPLPK
jgi:hypothetical protein